MTTDTCEMNHLHDEEEDDFDLYIYSDQESVGALDAEARNAKRLEDGADDFDLYAYSDVDSEVHSSAGDEDYSVEEQQEELSAELQLISRLMANKEDLLWLELQNEYEHMDLLIEALQSNRMVRNVTVQPTFLPSLKSDDEKRRLSSAICQLPHLQRLTVHDEISRYFLEPLYVDPPRNLKKLSLVLSEGEGDSVLIALIKMIENSICLETLSLRCEIMDYEMVMAIAKALHTNTSLKTLSLWGCQVMDDTVVFAMARALENNFSLKTLSFWSQNVQVTEIGKKMSAKIDYFLKLNQSGIRNLQLHSNITPDLFLRVLIAERHKLNHVFHLLSTNPAFVAYALPRMRK